MTSTSLPDVRRWMQRVERTGLLPAGIFLGLAFWVTPIAELVEFDYDEGINLVKALLKGEGYALYTEVWSDQPPMYTYLLMQLYDWIGPSLTLARVATLGFSTLLVWSLYQLLRLRVSVLAATVGVTLLVISSEYLRLSVSVMLGLPALAMGTLAIYLLLRSQRIAHSGWAHAMLAASGAAFAMSMHLKLFTLVALPAMMLTLIVSLWQANAGSGTWRTIGTKATKQIGIWTAAGAAVFAAITVRFDALVGEQLLGTHAAAQGGSLREHVRDLLRLAEMIGRHAIYLPLAAAAVMWAWRYRSVDVLLPAIWFVTAVAVLSVHRPLWYHT